MVDPTLADITPVVTIVALVGGMLFGAVRWLSGQAEKKADRVREVAEKTAQNVSDQAIKTAADLKKLTEDIARDNKIYSDGISRDARAYYDQKNSDMLVKIGEVDRKVMEMLSDLRKRADLTNGNVSSIRTDIADLQEDIQMIFDEKAEALQDDDPSSKMIIQTRKREQEKRRRNKRRAIEKDRVDQSERSLNREH